MNAYYDGRMQKKVGSNSWFPVRLKLYQAVVLALGCTLTGSGLYGLLHLYPLHLEVEEVEYWTLIILEGISLLMGIALLYNGDRIRLLEAQFHKPDPDE